MDGAKRALILSFILAFFLIPFSSAAYFSGPRGVVESVINAYIDIFEPILGALFGGQGWSSFYLFERFLLFIILAVFIYVILEKFPAFGSHKGIRRIISVIVPLIGIRFIDYAMLESILLQYELLAIALTSIFPFLLYFYFVYTAIEDYPFARKLAWALFLIVYIGLWTTTSSDRTSIVYFWTFLASIGCLIFDRSIKHVFDKRQMQKQDSRFKWREIGKLNEEIDKLNDQVAKGQLPQSQGKKLIDDLVRQRKDVQKHL